MRKLILTLAIAALPLAAQVQTATYVADLTPSLQNPPLEGVDASGTGIIHITKTYENGDVVSAIVDFRVMLDFGQEEQLAAFHIHRGAAGTNGGVVINPRFQGPLAVGPGSATVFQSTGVLTDQAALDVIAEVEASPAAFYYNVHTLSNRSGIVRGQLRRANNTMLSMLLQKAADAEAVDMSQSDDIERIGRTVDAIARRLGIVPAQ